MPMSRFPAGIITWQEQQIEDTDVQTQKLLRACGGFYPYSCSLRLYAKRKEAGWGLVCITTIIQDKAKGSWNKLGSCPPPAGWILLAAETQWWGLPHSDWMVEWLQWWWLIRQTPWWWIKTRRRMQQWEMWQEPRQEEGRQKPKKHQGLRGERWGVETLWWWWRSQSWHPRSGRATPAG